MKQIVVLASLFLASSAALAGPKAKTPPPPVPTYWIGEFSLEDGAEAESGKVQDGFVLVKTGDAPEKGIIVEPIAPKHLATAALGLGDNHKIYSTECVTPTFEDRMHFFPNVLVVDQATYPKPALIKNKKLDRAVRKLLVKDPNHPISVKELKSWSSGLVDLDADGLGDVMMLYGCVRDEWDECVSQATFIYQRDGASWKDVPIPSIDE